MTKTLLLAATAVGAIAFAGSASAIDITSATVSGVTVVAPAVAPATGTVYTPYRLASQAAIPTGGLQTTDTVGNPAVAQTTVTSALSANAGNLAAGVYVVRFEYTGMNGFTRTPTLTTSGQGTCTVQNTLSSGGTTTSTFVEFAVTVTGNCTANPSFTVAAPFKQTTLASTTVKSTISLNGVFLDNSATAPARTLVSLVNGYNAGISGTVDNALNGVDNADFPTRLALGTGTVPYTGFTANGSPQGFDNIIGALGFAGLTGADATYVDLTGTTQTSGVIPNMDVTINGAFQGLNVRLTTDDAGSGPIAPTSVNNSQALFTNIVGGRYNVTLAPVTGNSTQLGGGNYNAAFSSVADARLNAPLATGQTALETVLLEGTNFVAPWLQMQSQNYNAIVRISNLGGSATGPITLTLRANNGGTVNQTCQLTQAMLSAGTLVGGGIDQNKAIEFSGRTLANQCFGTTSTNADLQVTIQGTSTNLTAKVRIINPDSSVTESALGRLGELAVAF